MRPSSIFSHARVANASVIRAFQSFGGFTSGIGVHYAPSTIVNPANQSLASGLIVGQRLPPHIFIRAADARPFDIQDVLPSDTRFKVLAFVGNTTNDVQMHRIHALATYLDGSDSFFRRFGGSDPSRVFDLLAISSATKDELNYTDLPVVFRSHWSK